ncbi:hypothetical protein M2323_004145 [Rhodoblastus acidophilus]|nr:hypothetical protein [Rhodoblastus acidophilus]MCW2335199.1 hypothetical protein [Rhodoblastus acidophilus]
MAAGADASVMDTPDGVLRHTHKIQFASLSDGARH